MASKALLVFGATGSTGKRVVQAALAKNLRVTALVRNPARVPADWTGVTIVKGDLNDAASVAAAVTSARPDAIVDASSSLPFGHATGAQPNDADRGVALKAAIDALEAGGRLGDCNIVIVGGVVLPEPGGAINSWKFSALRFVVGLMMPGLVASSNKFMEYLFLTSPPALRFTMARPGHMEDAPSRGTLVAEATTGGNYVRGAVSFVDVGVVLVDLAVAEPANNPWNRKAVFLNYPHAA